MNSKGVSSEENLTRRFYLLNICVAIILLLTIFVSVYHFGGEAWRGQRQVALILPGVKENLGWDRSQYLAVKSVCEDENFSLVLRENIPNERDSCKKVVDELVKSGVTTICFTNGLKLNYLNEFEKIYPQVSFSTIEIISALWSGGSYSILAFEGSYLAGILAGLHTKTNKIGYVAPYSEPEVNQGINAFTIGVQRVNPDAEVLLNWTNTWDNPASDEQAVRNLKAQGVDVVTYHENGSTVPDTAERAGMYFISYNEVYPNHNYCIGSLRIDWKKVYSDMIRYRKGLRTGTTSHNAFGVSSSVVDLVTANNKLSTRERVLIETAKWEMKSGRFIFSGNIFDRNDVRRCSENETIGFYKLQKNMDWLIKGVRIVGI